MHTHELHRNVVVVNLPHFYKSSRRYREEVGMSLVHTPRAASCLLRPRQKLPAAEAQADEPSTAAPASAWQLQTAGLKVRDTTRTTRYKQHLRKLIGACIQI